MALYALVCALLVATFARPAAADTLDDVRATKKLVWGADQEGGGPFVFPRDDDPSQVQGFEVDVAARLAEYLKVKPEFSQGNWDRLPDLLNARKIQIILNGYEWSPVRAESMAASIPYYVYSLQLVARKDDGTLKVLDDLKKRRADGQKRKVGSLTGSAAQKYLSENFANDVEIVPYDGSTDCLREVETAKLDATMQDSPIISFYGSRFPKLAPIGEPVGRGHYVIFAKKADTALISAINEALVLMSRNGDLERIYRKYGIWNPQQSELAGIVEAGRFYGLSRAVEAEVKANEMPTEEAVQVGTRKHGWVIVRDYSWILVQAAGLTVALSGLAFPCAIVLGMLVAIGRMYGPAWVKKVLTLYVEFLRGTPLMLQLYFIFFFLPELGIQIPAFTTGILGLAINYSAYEAEVYRGGLQAIPPGQMEAGLSLGMSRAMTIRRIIVPQAARIVIPPVMNDFIAMFKDTSVCSVVTLVELTKRYSVLSMSTQATIELMVMTAVLYLMMSYPMSLLARRLELKLSQAQT